MLQGNDEVEPYTSPLPYTYITEDDLPESFSWDNVNGKSYVTRSLNQHIPQVNYTTAQLGARMNFSL